MVAHFKTQNLFTFSHTLFSFVTSRLCRPFSFSISGNPFSLLFPCRSFLASNPKTIARLHGNRQHHPPSVFSLVNSSVDMEQRRICTVNPPAAATDSEEAETVSETGPESPSCDDLKVEAPSPKRRKTVQKKVVAVPIGDVEGSKSKVETYPPSDSWAWRKYGQKPIKGSPYPRGYYRCSSAKGCPARKQVERSQADPAMLIVTYACEHNHPLPANKSSASTSASTVTQSANANEGPCSSGGATAAATVSSSPRFEPEEPLGLRDRLKLELPSSDSVAVLLGEEFSWFDDVCSASIFESPICSEEDDVAWMTKEEDDSLFADLGELPECSAVFRRSRFSLSSSGIPCGGSTG